MLTVVDNNDDSNETRDAVGPGRSLLDEIVRDGAWQLLAAALQAEVAAYIEQFADQVDENGHRLVVRNGYHIERDVLTAAGAANVKAPRVNDKRADPDTGERQKFSSAILPAWARKSPQMNEILPLLYLHGLSTSDFGPALEQFLGSVVRYPTDSAPLSVGTVRCSRANPDRPACSANAITGTNPAAPSRFGSSHEADRTGQL